jgi:hypothetical protein
MEQACRRHSIRILLMAHHADDQVWGRNFLNHCRMSSSRITSRWGHEIMLVLLDVDAWLGDALGEQVIVVSDVIAGSRQMHCRGYWYNKGSIRWTIFGALFVIRQNCSWWGWHEAVASLDLLEWPSSLPSSPENLFWMELVTCFWSGLYWILQSTTSTE